jgi:pimeloyl-ACP methyl ester carboxylesterase
MNIRKVARPLCLALGSYALLHGQSPEIPKSHLTLTHAEFHVPLAEAGEAGLQTDLIFPGTPGKQHPLVLMTHGSNYSKGANQEIGPGLMQPGAVWFARRGWVVAIVIRRGYGASGGKMDQTHGGCSEGAFAAIAGENAADLKAVYNAVKNFPQVDGNTVIAIGNSAGGFAALAFGADAPSALKAVINFSGGWHSLFFAGTCAKIGLIPEFHNLGAATHVPTLWLYAKNDRLFPPKYVAEMHDAFTSGGGAAEIPSIGKSGDDGHYLFSEGMETWTPFVESFLKQHDLPWQDLDPDYGRKVLQLPAIYPSDMKDAFQKWQRLGPYGAFAVGPNGEWSYSSGCKTPKIAKNEALDGCRNSHCKVVATRP